MPERHHDHSDPAQTFKNGQTLHSCRLSTACNRSASFAVPAQATSRFTEHAVRPLLPILCLRLDLFARKDLFEQITRIAFWTTSCAACVNEMLMLTPIYQQYQARGDRTHGCDHATQPTSYMMNFIRSLQLPFEVVIGHTGQLARNWGAVQAAHRTIDLTRSCRHPKSKPVKITRTGSKIFFLQFGHINGPTV